MLWAQTYISKDVTIELLYQALKILWGAFQASLHLE